MTDQLRKAIYDVGKTVSGISSRFYSYEAPDGTTMPYCVFSDVTGLTSFDSVNLFYEEHVQVSAYATTIATLETIENSLFAKFHDQKGSFSMTDYHCNQVVNEFRRKAALPNDVFQLIHQYKFLIQKK